MLLGLEQAAWGPPLPEMYAPTWHRRWPVLLTLTVPPQQVSAGIPYTRGRHCHPPQFNPIRSNSPGRGWWVEMRGWWRQTRRQNGLKQRRHKEDFTPKRERGGTLTGREAKNRRRNSEGTDFTLAGPSAVVWYEPSSAGIRLGWAHLTGVTPCPSHGGTAQGLCAHNASELALTHLVIHRGKAGSSTVVWKAKCFSFLWKTLHKVRGWVDG